MCTAQREVTLSKRKQIGIYCHFTVWAEAGTGELQFFPALVALQCCWPKGVCGRHGNLGTRSSVRWKEGPASLADPHQHLLLLCPYLKPCPFHSQWRPCKAQHKSFFCSVTFENNSVTCEPWFTKFNSQPSFISSSMQLVAKHSVQG